MLSQYKVCGDSTIMNCYVSILPSRQWSTSQLQITLCLTLVSVCMTLFFLALDTPKFLMLKAQILKSEAPWTSKTPKKDSRRREEDLMTQSCKKWRAWMIKDRNRQTCTVCTQYTDWCKQYKLDMHIDKVVTTFQFQDSILKSELTLTSLESLHRFKSKGKAVFYAVLSKFWLCPFF